MKSGPRILKHFGVGRASFYLFYLFIFIYFHLFYWILLPSLISSIPKCFSYFYCFFRVCRKMIAPPLPKQVGFKNANRTRKLENRIVSFFFQREFRIDLSIPVIEFCTILWRKNHIFWIFVNFAIFGSPEPTFSRILESGPRILESGPRILKHFEVRPKDFKAFWSRPGLVLFVLFVYFYLFLFISIDFYWFP